jgi:hypothetical protein
MGDDKVLNSYIGLEEEYGLLFQKEKRILFILSVLRLFVFFGGLGLLWFAFTIGSLAGILSFAFFFRITL